MNDKAMLRSAARELAALRGELAKVSDELHCAYRAFNAAVEDDLIYSSIYEINMLRARHTYILRKIKQLGAPRPEPPEESGE